jgi:hypothetical protein
MLLLLSGGSGESRLKPVLLSYAPLDEIQSCQVILVGMAGMMGWNGLGPRTRHSWMMNSDAKGT